MTIVRKMKTIAGAPHLIAFLLFLAVSTSGLAQDTRKTPDSPFDYGRVEGSRYLNDFFGLQLDIPAHWVVTNGAALKQLQESSFDTFRSTNPQIQRSLAAARNRGFFLLAISQFALGTRSRIPVFICGSEKIPDAAGVFKASDYADRFIKLSKQSTVPMTATRDAVPEIIGGVEFAVVDVKVKTRDQDLHQRHYVYVTKGYALIFMVTYFNDADLRQVGKILRSVNIRPDFHWRLKPEGP